MMKGFIKGSILSLIVCVCQFTAPIYAADSRTSKAKEKEVLSKSFFYAKENYYRFQESAIEKQNKKYELAQSVDGVKWSDVGDLTKMKGEIQGIFYMEDVFFMVTTESDLSEGGSLNKLYRSDDLVTWKIDKVIENMIFNQWANNESKIILVQGTTIVVYDFAKQETKSIEYKESNLIFGEIKWEKGYFQLEASYNFSGKGYYTMRSSDGKDWWIHTKSSTQESQKDKIARWGFNVLEPNQIIRVLVKQIQEPAYSLINVVIKDIKKDFYSYAYNGERYVAINSEGVFTSEDGVKWSRQSKMMSNNYNEITFQNGRFILSGHTGALYESKEGEVWKPIFLPTFKSLRSVSYDGIEYAILASSFSGFSSIYKGQHLTNLQAYDLPLSKVKQMIKTEKGYIVIGGHCQILYSEDAIKWSLATFKDYKESPFGYTFETIAYGQGRYVVGGDAGVGEEAILLISEDGVTWKQVQSHVKSRIIKVEWNGKGFVGFDKNGAVIESEDGIKWKEIKLHTKTERAL